MVVINRAYNRCTPADQVVIDRTDRTHAPLVGRLPIYGEMVGADDALASVDRHIAPRSAEVSA